jgi:hypothetical protein
MWSNYVTAENSLGSQKFAEPVAKGIMMIEEARE